MNAKAERERESEPTFVRRPSGPPGAGRWPTTWTGACGPG